MVNKNISKIFCGFLSKIYGGLKQAEISPLKFRLKYEILTEIGWPNFKYQTIFHNLISYWLLWFLTMEDHPNLLLAIGEKNRDQYTMYFKQTVLKLRIGPYPVCLSHVVFFASLICIHLQWSPNDLLPGSL